MTCQKKQENAGLHQHQYLLPVNILSVVVVGLNGYVIKYPGVITAIQQIFGLPQLIM